jgi:hypothetical protein
MDHADIGQFDHCSYQKGEHSIRKIHKFIAVLYGSETCGL